MADRLRMTAGATLVALVAALLVAVTGSTASAALPPECGNTSDTNVYRWTGGGGSDNTWSNAANWAHGAGNLAGVPTTTAIACVSGFVVAIDSIVHVQALDLANAPVSIQPGNALFTDGPALSVWDHQSQLNVGTGTFGGTGPIEMHAVITVLGAAVLSSLPGGPGTTCGAAGSMTVASDGYLIVEAGSLALRTCYQLGISGQLWVGLGGGFVTADWGTTTTVNAGGKLDFRGDGGYYQGSPVAGRSLGSFVNAGTVVKSGGAQPSVIDAAYSQTATGTVGVDAGTLALPGSGFVAGSVAQGSTLGTAACGTSPSSPCPGSQDPAVDPMSVTFQVPASNPGDAIVQLQELTEQPDTTDSRAIGNDVFAHAEQLQPAPGDYATIHLRYSQPDVMATPLDQVQVAHISDAGVMSQTPDCSGAGLPAGATYCVVRPVLRDAQNTFVTVRTIQTSRWRLRRIGPSENFAQGLPTAPQSLAAVFAASDDGSSVRLVWAPPADDGGAAVTGYRVYRDGVLFTTTDLATAVVTDPGPGLHRFSVSAVNALGEGTPATRSLTLAALSKPRKVTGIQGSKGGKATAGVKWKPPAAAGGLALTGYKVAVFKANGKKVGTKIVKAGQRKYLFKLKNGRYFFKVRARNSDRWGPWSKKTALVRPR